MKPSLLPSRALLSLLLMAALVPATAGVAYPVSFGTNTDFPTGAAPTSVAMGDLNGDCRLDMVAANRNGNTISVLMGNGAGGFGPKTDFSAGIIPFSVAIEDISGDGRPDVVVANAGYYPGSPGSVSVFLGDGAGGFAPRTDYAAGTEPYNIVIGDVSGDSKADLVVANLVSNTVSVFLGDGAGGFGPKTDLACAGGPTSTAIGDVNLDAKPDLVVTSWYANAISVFLSDGVGGFGPKTDFPTGSSPRTVALGDVNSDGRLDAVVAAASANSVAVHLGNGTGGFGPGTNFAVGTLPRQPAIADLDLDGRLDIAVTNQNSSTVSVLLGDGTGGFGPKTDLAVGTSPFWVALGDLDADGRLDMAVVNNAVNTASVLLNTSPYFGFPPSAANSTVPSTLSVGANGTCCFDVIVHDLFGNPITGSKVVVDFGNGVLNFCPTQPLGHAVECSAVRVFTDVSGTARFCICANVALPCSVSIRADGVLLAASVPLVPCASDSTRCFGPDTWAHLTGPGVAGSPVAPSARWGHAMVTDSKRGTIVLFGGANMPTNFGDTWEWDGFVWTQDAPATSPPARRMHSMAFDKARGRVVLFGGTLSGAPFGDTWEWDGLTWEQVASTGPSPRHSQSMVYDDVRRCVVLFGGFDGTPRDDMWTWDGIAWSQVTATIPAPSARFGAAMAYDEDARTIFLAGGDTGAGLSGETWEWNGSAWALLDATSAQPVRGASMAYSPDCGRLLLYGDDGSTVGRWDGVKWKRLPAALGVRLFAGMAYDVVQGRSMLFGGWIPPFGPTYNDTWAWCSGCRNEPAEVDSLGNDILPDDLDPAVQVTFNDVDSLAGSLSDLYPGKDLATADWYLDFPCEPSIDEEPLPPEVNINFTDSLSTALNMTVDPQEMSDSLTRFESLIWEQASSEPDTFGTSAAGWAPFTPPAQPHCISPEDPRHYAFGGRDIIFVHGLMMEPLAQKVFGTPEDVNVEWHVPRPYQGRIENPSFYGDGWWKTLANAYWADHIQRFLVEKGFSNRYLVVSYPVTQRLEVGVRAILTQIVDAMRDGTGVVDLSGRNDVQGFGTPSFVVVSHSTGGLITDVAMSAAQIRPNLGATVVPKLCKAHIALDAAISGSRLATAVIIASGYCERAFSNNVPEWVCPLVNVTFGMANEIWPAFPAFNCPPNFSALRHSVLVDLVPLVAQLKWGPKIETTPVRDLTVVGGHPSYVSPFKWLIHPGYDDGVCTINSQVGNPNTTALWPSGYHPKGALGFIKVFDRGLWSCAGSPANRGACAPKRAALLYVDQVLDRAFNPLNLVASPFPLVAAGATPYLSPTGMVQPFGQNYHPTNGFNPLRRYSNHFSFLQSSMDHFGGSTGLSHTSYPNGWNGNAYRNTFGEINDEEQMVITDEGVFAPFNTDGVSFGSMYYPGESAPILNRLLLPPWDQEYIRGRQISFGRLGKFLRKSTKVRWRWMRRYHLLQNWQTKMACDYVYEYVLRGANTSCDPSPLGIGGDSQLRLAARSSPNPAIRGMAISYTLPGAGHVDIAVYDAAGRRIRTLVSGSKEQGAHIIHWDGRNSAGGPAGAGVYFWRLVTGGQELTGRAVLLK
ncbi:MAG: VCBS repeat-containing protein [Candidatus Eisenbacteria bacterium]|nr:VCBS repeat-containing protein [Candidatus Eisenbacteria bacterium]